ncbi:hypothetical protein KKH27_09450 [bacterium]|nr:hypothetical protein [bacterium]MBU1985278.1 hypothetical protein [bacterium]
MEPKDLFSRRRGFDKPVTLWEDQLPENFVDGVRNVLDEAFTFTSESFEGCFHYVSLRLGWEKPYPLSTYQFIKLLRSRAWHQVLTALELVFEYCILNGLPISALRFQENMDYLFDVGHINWHFDNNGRLVKRVENITVIEKALSETVESLATAREHLKKAWDLFNKRPEADLPNCALEAVKAVESAALIVSGKKKGTFKEVLQELGLHPALSLGLEKIHAYRGDEAGVGHGKAELPDVTREEAELVLTVCAAIVTFLSEMKSKREASNRTE